MEGRTAFAESNGPKFSEVLPLILQHAQDLSTTHDICSLLQVSTAVRHAVQQSRAHCCVSFSPGPNALRCLSGFATWLPAHSGLVSKLELEWLQPPAASTTDTATSTAAAMLQLALRVCVEQETKPPQPATTPAPAAAADDSSALQDAAPLPLRLSCLSADVAITSPAALRLLAALGLQGLKLLLQPAQVTAALCSALSRMHSVRHVELTLPEGKELPVQLAAALGQLTQLTHLHVRSGVGQEAGKVLPAALEHLQLDMDKVHPSDALDLSHLTSLSAAVIVNETDDVMQLVLPAQSGVELSLELDGRVDMQAGSGVACLTVSYYNLEDWQALHFLSAQPHLRALCLYNYDRPYPVEEADVSGCAGIAAELEAVSTALRIGPAATAATTGVVVVGFLLGTAACRCAAPVSTDAADWLFVHWEGFE